MGAQKSVGTAKKRSKSSKNTRKKATKRISAKRAPAKRVSSKRRRVKQTPPKKALRPNVAQTLMPFFAPKSVAVIGATEKPDSVGRTMVWNLIANAFGGAVYPINPKRKSVLGIKAYPSIHEVPEQVELVIVVTPAVTVPGIIEECGRAGVRHVVIISAGFKEIGAEGIAMEKKILKIARSFGMRLIGPNCLGVMCPISGLNATFASTIAGSGSVGFISQSGALCTSILDWSLKQNVGFSAFVSIGSMLDVDWGDLIYHLGDDPRTKSILIYMESVGDASSFLSAAREVALRKPIIVIKPGRTQAAIKAASTHTGGMAGSDAVLDAAFRRCGVLRVDSIEDLFLMADVVGKQPPPKGPRLSIVTNAGGAGVIATDALITDGGTLAKIGPESMRALNAFLPAHWSRGNPIDILGDATAERYAKALAIALEDPGCDGVLLVLSPQAMTDATKVAEAVSEQIKNANKPVLASWMGEVEIARGVEILNRAGVPTFPYPDSAVRVFNYLSRYTYNLKGLYETPLLPQDFDGNTKPGRVVSKLLAKVRASGRALLTEAEAKDVFKAYGIPVVETKVAKTVGQAEALAKRIGFPVVLKLNSFTLTHKTDVQGVQLNLCSTSQVRKAFGVIKKAVEKKAGRKAFQGVTVQPMVKQEGYELILGSTQDAQFGPVLLFGLGGQLVEVFKDSSLGLPPLTTTLARRMMEQTKIYKALQGVRGRKPIDQGELEQLLVRFSQLVAEQPWIKEIDINPLLASPEGCIALDARILQHEPKSKESKLPKLAIRPYPSNYVWSESLSNGSRVTIRPIRPEDEPLLIQLHTTLSEQTVHHRYFSMFNLSQRIEHDRLSKICFIDYDREVVLAAVSKNGGKRPQELFGVGRLNKHRHSDAAEFALLIADKHQKKGLGFKMLSKLLEIAKEEKIGRVVADILIGNEGMQQVCKKLGFRMWQADDVVKAEIIIR